MKRIFTVIFLLAMLLSLAACGTAQPNTPTAPEPGPAQPGEPLPPVNVPEASVIPLGLMCRDCYLNEWTEDFNHLCSAGWQELMLMEESAAQYPELVNWIDDLNAYNREYADTAMAQMLPEAQAAYEEVGEDFWGFVTESDFVVLRADSRLVSIREDAYEYTGGVHPMYGSFGINCDPTTGRHLSLDDVLTDVSGIAQLVAERLEQAYPDEPFFDLAETLGAYAPEDWSWTMDYQGITFYFIPYEIAAYASGQLTATIWFDEMPELFREEYMQAPAGGYAVMLPLNSKVSLDLNPEDAMRDELTIGAWEDEYGTLELTIICNGVTYVEDAYAGFELTPYLVVLNDGGTQRSSLYIESVAENDYRSIYTYSLADGALAQTGKEFGTGFARVWQEAQDGEEYGATYRHIFNDPTQFRLTTRTDTLGTRSGWREYRADPADGALIPQTEYYFMDGRTIVSAIDLEVLMLPELQPETLPAGTEFRFLRTDNDSWAELALEDGRECRIEIEHEDWTPTINGVAEWDCFVDLPYAG